MRSKTVTVIWVCGRGAVEHETGRCFLGRSKRDALTIAKQSMPDREFLSVSVCASAVA